AVLVNVGRGQVVDEDALYEALSSGQLLGAGVDCWYKYPTSVASRQCTPVSDRLDFASLPNLVLSPHRAGAVGLPRTEQARMHCLAKLCNAAVEGGVWTMPNRVDMAKGY
ncbi:unnamed protein product, partial [Polarella glacialis]